MKKVLFLHGWCSDGGTKAAFIRSFGNDIMAPRLSDWWFTNAVQTGQQAFDEFSPDVIVGSSRGGAVAMALDSGTTPLILLAPAWRRWGKARSVKTNTVVIHSSHDEIVPFADSVELCHASGIRLIAAGVDHRLNCQEGRQALCLALYDIPKGQA